MHLFYFFYFTVSCNLNNVFFTIDLEKGLIYNADSLPKGTKITELRFSITTDSASEVNITNVDTTYNYLNNKEMTNNMFAPAYIEVVSRSRDYKKSYQLKVNVHKLDPDQLFWGGVQYASLPGNGTLKNQHTVKYQEHIYCFMTRDDKQMLAITTHPADEWQITELTLDFTPNWQSLRASDDIIGVLDNNNNLYTSTDGINWTKSRINPIIVAEPSHSPKMATTTITTDTLNSRASLHNPYRPSSPLKDLAIWYSTTRPDSHLLRV